MSHSSNDNQVNIEILGKEYRVACSAESRQDLERAAKLLNDRMAEIKAQGKIYGGERVAIMAALNLAHDYLNAIGGSQSMQSQMRDINNKIENALAQDQQQDLGDL